MTYRSAKDQADAVRSMFSRIAGRYDITNRWMTFWQDVKWRREVIDKAHLPMGGKLLDVGCGTGDLALETLQRDPSIFIMAADFTPEMMRLGRMREGGGSVCWVNSDALNLPVATGTFDAVVSGYLLRNVSDVSKALTEQYRILKPGGVLVCLDTTPPPMDWLHLPVRLYLRLIIPIIGGWVAGEKEAYRYLPESTRTFVGASELAKYMREAGFDDIGYRTLMGDAIAIHWGIK